MDNKQKIEIASNLRSTVKHFANQKDIEKEDMRDLLLAFQALTNIINRARE